MSRTVNSLFPQRGKQVVSRSFASQAEGSAITRSDAFALVVAKPSAYPPFPQRGKQAVPLRPSLVFLAEGSAITRSDAFALVVAKLGDLCDTALGTYDAEQSYRVSSCLWGAGFPPNAPSLAHWRQRTSLCAAPYMGSLTRSLLICLRKDVALV